MSEPFDPVRERLTHVRQILANIRDSPACSDPTVHYAVGGLVVAVEQLAMAIEIINSSTAKGTWPNDRTS